MGLPRSKFPNSYLTALPAPSHRLPISALPALSHRLPISALILFVLRFCVQPVFSQTNPEDIPKDVVHTTAILGESVVFNCAVDFPGDIPVPYVLQWEKDDVEIPIFIWYENYPIHNGAGFEGRVSRVSSDSHYGLASLNLSNIRESDQGYYTCKVVFLNRPDAAAIRNGTWFKLDVHAPPRFKTTPEEVIYVHLGDALILRCEAQGTPQPEIVWYKASRPIVLSPTTAVFNGGTELRMSNLRPDDVADYTCIARNGEGQISHTARLTMAGAAVIMNPPANQTRLEGERVEMTCGARANPANVTNNWFKDGVPVREVALLEKRVSQKKDGSLVINPVGMDDSGYYTCEVTNGIGEPQIASAFLNVEYSARVTFVPTVQYIPFRMAGVVQCFIKANPPLQYVTWTKDKRLLEPYQTKDIIVMQNGSLLFTRVNQNHQGVYTCTPYNTLGTLGTSGPMEVLVKKPPAFLVEPLRIYQKKVGESVDMHCEAQESEGTQRPKIEWQRTDGQALPRGRVRISGGNLTIDLLRRTDFGYYQCVASNEVATIISTTQLVVEGTQPHAPYNLSGNATEFAVAIHWLPGYSGGSDYKQEYTVWYREAGVTDWNRIPVTPPSSTEFTVNGLRPGTLYEFQVVGKNALGDGMLSNIISVKTLDFLDCSNVIYPTHSLYPYLIGKKGPKPGPPRNITITEKYNGFLLAWQPPEERPELIKYYTVKYRTDSKWKDLTRDVTIRPDEPQYLVKNMVGGKTYFFRVIAHTGKGVESSTDMKYSVPADVKRKAIMAGVVGGILFFLVAIILSICIVKMCNRRKRRRQEKAYKMVASRITDSRNNGQIPPVRQIPLHKRREFHNQMLNILTTCVAYPHRSCIYVSDTSSSSESESCQQIVVRPISRAPDGRFVLNTSRTASISSSIDDGGFLTHPSFGGTPQRPLNAPLSLPSDLSYDSRQTPRQLQTPRIYSNTTPFLSSSPAMSQSPPFSPMYFEDVSSVRQSSGSAAERTLRSVREQYSHELPSLKVIHEETEQNINARHAQRRLPQRQSRTSRSAPELANVTPESQSSSSGVGSKNTSQQTGSSGTIDWKNMSYKSPHSPAIPLPPPPPQIHPMTLHQIPKPPPLRTWLDYSPSPTTSVLSNKPISVEDHYEFDSIFPASPTPTEVVLTPLPPQATPRQKTTPTSHGRPSRQEDIEARVQAMKEEFHEYRRRKAQLMRLGEFESPC